MAAALTLLLVGVLLQSVLCGEYKVTVPQFIEALIGSCVTIPCSFDIANTTGREYLDKTCKALWKTDQHHEAVFDRSDPQAIKGTFNGDFINKDCNTTLNNMRPKDSRTYFLRVDCGSGLKYNFMHQVLTILVKDDPPKLALTLSAPKVAEGSSVSLRCSAPAPCSSHPPTLSWTPRLGDSRETLQRKGDKTEVQTSVLTFTASHLHHRENITCTAVYSKQDGSPASSVSATVTAEILYSPKHTTVSVSPSGPVPENSTLTLTCSSAANPAVRSYTWHRADGGRAAFIGSGRVLNITASKTWSAFFCEAVNYLGAQRSNVSLIDVQFTPEILPSPDCTTSADQLNCFCETAGNPAPTLKWYLDGLPVNHSDQFVTWDERLSDARLRGSITVTRLQRRDISTLLCRGTNPLGSAAHRFYVFSLEVQTSAESKNEVTFPVLITIVAALLIVVCALLLVIRAQRTQHDPPRSPVARSQLLTSGTVEIELPDTTEEDIYVNANITQSAALPERDSGDRPNSGAGDSSEKKDEEGKDVLYTTVTWKSKTKKKEEDAVDVEGRVAGGMCKHPASNALEMDLYDELQPEPVKEKVECEYAQVKFKNKSLVCK